MSGTRGVKGEAHCAISLPPFAKSREGWGTHCTVCHRKAGPPTTTSLSYAAGTLASGKYPTSRVRALSGSGV